MASYAAPPATPQAQISNRHSVAASPTRSMPQAESTHHPLSQPASQESFTTVQSQGSSVGPQLQSDSSTLSQLTNYTEPKSPGPTVSQRPLSDAYTSQPRDAQRVKTPDYVRSDGHSEPDHALASPMSVTSPMSVNGAKRTASGHVKNAPSLGSMPATPMTAMHGRTRSRAESTSSTNSRAGELAQTLKARLGYAMAKVQNGWEHNNIAEVERMSAHKSQNRHSVTYGDYTTRPVSPGRSIASARMSAYDPFGKGIQEGLTSPPSKRRSGNFAGYTNSPKQRLPTPSTGPALQPPVDIRPTSSRRAHDYSAPSSQQSQYTSSAMSPPRTPINGRPRRPLNVRTDTQTAQAERDALDALFQLGSPHGTSQHSQFSRQISNFSQDSSQQGSPLRGEYVATPRRVTFARSESDQSSSAGEYYTGDVEA
ncbi:hypothetical protein D0860_05556 [Hortaea werneckii]|uniref:Uncharacterized protein n=1 Tax=Hortaea werneckii TaxID=91943 RepID=A0A3M7H0B3_HORWE|nr:hypothetical protein D0860_05556 [Hortaea werneckii]